MLENSLVRWRALHKKIRELDAWLKAAEKELKNASARDPRMKIYGDVLKQRGKLLEQIEEVELEQECALTDVLERAGPTTFIREDGSSDVVAAGGLAGALLPADLLSVWRVAEVFEGKVVLDSEKPQWGKPVEELPRVKKEKVTLDVGQGLFDS